MPIWKGADAEARTEVLSNGREEESRCDACAFIRPCIWQGVVVSRRWRAAPASKLWLQAVPHLRNGAPRRACSLRIRSGRDRARTGRRPVAMAAVAAAGRRREVQSSPEPDSLRAQWPATYHRRRLALPVIPSGVASGRPPAVTSALSSVFQAHVVMSSPRRPRPILRRVPAFRPDRNGPEVS